LLAKKKNEKVLNPSNQGEKNAQGFKKLSIKVFPPPPNRQKKNNREELQLNLSQAGVFKPE